MNRAPHPRNGFTLLEMMLSVAVFILLITSAFSLVGATTELMTEVSETQRESTSRLRFVETCRAAFQSSRSTSTLEFDYVDRGGRRFDSYLSFVDTPGAFDVGQNLGDRVERVVLAAEIRPDGFVRAGVYYMTAEEFADAKENGFVGIESRYVELLPRMRQLSWRFYDRRTDEWRPTLDRDFPVSLVELTIRTERDSTPLRSAFHFLGD